MSSVDSKYRKIKGRSISRSFLAIPHYVLDSESFRTLSPRATKLLIDLASQYRGKNNGDLSATTKMMAGRGWRSSDQLFKAIKELLDVGFLRKTRQGGRNRCNLFAVTWERIDECKGKLDVASTHLPPKDWLKRCKH